MRYKFPGKRLIDSLVDLPLALPTAVGGLVYASLYVENGWLGQHLVPLGIDGAYTRLGIVLVLVFVGLPFVAVPNVSAGCLARSADLSPVVIQTATVSAAAAR